MYAAHTVSATTMIDTEVVNEQGDNLGKIEEVMLDTVDGAVVYLVLSYGGLFGTTFADKRFAVPFDAFYIERSNGKVKYVLNVDKDFLEQAPGFDKDNYPDFADTTFQHSMRDYYRNLRMQRSAA